MYADDTQLYMSFSQMDSDQVLREMEKCLENVRSWMGKNYLKLNDSKTEFLVISQRGSKVVKLSNVESVVIGSDMIEASASAKNIGAVIDSHLTMEQQVSNVCRNCYIGLRQVSEIRPYITKDAAATLVNALVTSKLDCLNSLLYGLPEYQLRRLQLVQNNAARVVSRISRSASITQTLKELHWLPVSFRIEYKILLLCYKAVNRLAPEYLTELLSFYVPSRKLRSSSQYLLVEPKARLKTYGERAFSVCAPKLWNKLPPSVRDCDNVDTFKTKLKTYMFSKAFAHC